MRIQVNARNRALPVRGRCRGEDSLRRAARGRSTFPTSAPPAPAARARPNCCRGRVEDRWADAPGRKFVKPSAAEFLMCQCAAEDTLTLEVSSFVYPVEPGGACPRPAAARCATCGADARRARRSRWSSSGRAISTPDSSCCCAPEGVRGLSRAIRWCNFERGGRRLEFVVKKKPAAAFRSGCSAAEPRGRAPRAVRAARQGDLRPGSRQEHPVHRRRQRHRRHDVDPRPCDGERAISSSHNGRAVLRRAHHARRFLPQGAD